ncbi:MAG: ADP-glyceromanno-heptose 6-epimerase [Bacteroidales bacterium]|nr:ADP-glyceromanno-heptose 6-epimerase [Bacteroidales bacterium]
MIVVTGAAGFIGSNLVTGLNRARYRDVVLVDDFSRPDRVRNYEGKQFTTKVDRREFPHWVRENHRFVQVILHLGARTDTTELSWEVFQELNVDYSKEVFNLSIEFGLPVIYASSAATYGIGEQGYSDSHELVSSLEPLNPYGRSKNEFDRWVLSLDRKPFFWAGLKFFNVYGPNEYHKGRMASVVFHAFNQIRDTGGMKLFRSHHPDFRDGEQARDFIYVKDVVDVIIYLMENRPASGLYNLGTGRASTFLDLVTCTFQAMGKEPSISFIDTPEDIRERYQYFTEAKMGKLRDAGYGKEFTSLEVGVKEYVSDFLMNGMIY